MVDNEIKFQLTEHELEFLHNLHNAQAIRELLEHPGWPLIQHISRQIIERLEDQHLTQAGNVGISADAYRISGARLSGARSYAKILTETIFQQVGILEQKFVPPDPSLDRADLDGEM